MVQHLDQPKNNFKLAIGITLLSNFVYVVQAICVKITSPYFSVNGLVFVRSLLSLLVLYGWVLLKRKKINFLTLYQTKALKYQMIRSICGLGVLYCLYYGIFLMPVASATLLFFTFPIFIPVVARVWRGVSFIHRLWWGIGTSFIGIIIVLNPRFELFNPVALIPLLGAFLCSVSIIAIRVLNRTDTVDTVMAYYFLFSTIISGIIFFTFKGLSANISTLFGVWGALLVAVASTMFQALFTLAPKYAPVRFLSPFMYSVFIFAAIGDYFIWGKVVSGRVLIGFAFIVIGALLMIFLYPKQEHNR